MESLGFIQSEAVVISGRYLLFIQRSDWLLGLAKLRGSEDVAETTGFREDPRTLPCKGFSDFLEKIVLHCIDKFGDLRKWSLDTLPNKGFNRLQFPTRWEDYLNGN